MIDTLIEIGQCSGMEINMKQTTENRISRRQFPVQMVDKKNVKYLKYLGSLITSEQRCRPTRKIKPKIFE
jgi:hypothetical protein